MHCETHNNKMNHHGCCCGLSFHRHFLSNDEKIKQLQTYKDALEQEIKGLEKAIEQLRND